MKATGIPLRRIVEEDTFTAQAKRVTPDAKRFDEICEIVTFGLARDPESMGSPITGTDSWIHITRGFPESGAPSLEFTYAFDGATVYLRWVELHPVA